MFFIDKYDKFAFSEHKPNHGIAVSSTLLGTQSVYRCVFEWMGGAEACYLAQGSQLAQNYIHHHRRLMSDANLFVPHTKVMLDKTLIFNF